MAITRVRDPTIVIAASTETGSTSVTFSNGTTDVFARVIGRNNTTAAPASVTINSVGLTLVTDNTQTTRGHQLYWLPKASHPGNGSFTLATGAWTSNDRIGVAIAEYSTGTSLEAVTDNFVAGQSTNVDVAVSASSGDLTLSSCYRGGTPSYTPDSGQTEFLDGGAWPSGCNAAIGENTGALSTVDWTVVSGTGATASGLAAVFQEVAGGAIAGNTDLSLDLSATLLASGALAGDSQLELTVSGTLAGAGALAGEATAELALSGTLAASGSLGGVAECVLMVSGTLTGIGALAGEAQMALDASGTLSLPPGGMSGEATLQLQLSGAMAGAGALAGSALLGMSAAGSLSGVGALAGSTDLTLETSGALLGAGALSGSATMPLTLSGTMAGTGTMVGNATMVLALSGALSGGPRAPAFITGTWATVSPGVHATFEDIGPQTP